jgi:hypothetical protein
MAAFLDVCRFNPTAGGTTDWTYSTPVTGYQSPAAANVVNGRAYKYRAESADLSQWELGEGAYNTATGVLARSTVLYNSSGTTAKINFSAAPQVAIVALKEDLLSIEEANSFTDAQKQQARQNIYAAPFDAMAWSNLFVNGQMDVSQENGATSVSLASGTPKYVVDGWKCAFSNASASFVAQQSSTAPAGFINTCTLSAGGAGLSLSSGDYVYIAQPIEGWRMARLAWGTANAQPITVGFIIDPTIAGSNTISVAVQNSAKNRSYVTNVSGIAQFSWNFVEVTIPGDLSGTWLTNNSVGAWVYITLACGSSRQTTANAWASGDFIGTSSTSNFFASASSVLVTGAFAIAGNEGPYGNSFNPMHWANLFRPYDVELDICKRYYEKGTEDLLYLSSMANTGQYFTVHFMKEKRANGTVTQTGWQYISGGAGASCTPTLNNVDPKYFSYVLSGLTNAEGITLSGTWVCDARL